MRQGSALPDKMELHTGLVHQKTRIHSQSRNTAAILTHTHTELNSGDQYLTRISWLELKKLTILAENFNFERSAMVP